MSTMTTHHHRCPTCGVKILCRAKDCKIPNKAECSNCRSGYVDGYEEGQIVKVKKVPKRFDDDDEPRWRQK